MADHRSECHSLVPHSGPCDGCHCARPVEPRSHAFTGYRGWLLLAGELLASAGLVRLGRYLGRPR